MHGYGGVVCAVDVRLSRAEAEIRTGLTRCLQMRWSLPRFRPQAFREWRTLVPSIQPSVHQRAHPYAASAIAVAIVTAGLLAVRSRIGAVDVAMIYLLCVLGAALLAGRAPSLATAIAAFLLFDYLFLPPYGTFTIHANDHVAALLVFFAVALVTSHLVATVRERVIDAQQLEARANLLFQLNEGLVGGRSLDDILTTIVRHVVEIYGARRASILARTEDGSFERLATAPDGPVDPMTRNEEIVALQVLATGTPAGLGTGRARVRLPHGVESGAIRRAAAEDVLYLPIDTSERQIGLLEVRGRPDGGRFDQSDRDLLASLADQAALALERVRLTSEAARAAVLAQSDEVKTALLASVSHDLRTPLATIKTSVGALLDPRIDWNGDEQHDFLEVIDQETDRLTRMVTNLLDLSRIQSGALRPDRDWYDARDLIDQVVARLRPRAEASAHRIVTDIRGQVALGSFDYVEIDQVLTNVIENAIKYTPPGSTITIVLEVTANELHFAVADDGPGISRDERERVFDAFYRAPGSQRQQGSGLGLSICRGLVEAHGGQIWIERNDAGGATVRFTIPFDGTPTEQMGER